LERFFTLTKTLSIMPVMPSASVIEVRVPIRSGRARSRFTGRIPKVSVLVK